MLRHFVVDGVRIAASDAILRALRQLGFDPHDCSGSGRSLRRRIPNELQHLLHVRQVLFAQLDGLVVVFEIVVAIRQTKTALIECADHLLGVFRVLSGAEVKQRVDILAMKNDDFAQQLLFGLQSGDGVEVSFDRRDAALFDSGGIHAGREEIADLARHGVALRVVGRRLFEDVVERLAVPLGELVEAAPGRLVGWDRILCEPGSAGVLVEVDARVGFAVEGVDVETGGRFRLRGEK